MYGGAKTTVVARATVCQKIPYISQGNVAMFKILCDLYKFTAESGSERILKTVVIW